tara:strand:+ start:1369 stop:1782 length:414 start_codon:yes stop_codon:yes gene_type:complete
MIKYNLKCENKHEFESWFSESKEYERLKKKKLIECIFCGSKKIEKSIMSPRILNSKSTKVSENQDLKKFKRDLINVRKFVEKNFEFVEHNFADKIREVYYNKNNKRNIYGVATDKEKEDLKEEGIDLISIPWVEKDN